MDEKEEGKLVFFLNGEKLKGRYCMVKIQGSENWLFFKC